jgi:hypothetical protein
MPLFLPIPSAQRRPAKKPPLRIGRSKENRNKVLEERPAKKNCTQREEAGGRTFARRLEEVEKEQFGKDFRREDIRSLLSIRETGPPLPYIAPASA